MADRRLLPGCSDQACADGDPSARIADCARMKSTSARNRRSWIKATPSR